jgi:hypothetical protein
VSHILLVSVFILPDLLRNVISYVIDKSNNLSSSFIYTRHLLSKISLICRKLELTLTTSPIYMVRARGKTKIKTTYTSLHLSYSLVHESVDFRTDVDALVKYTNSSRDGVKICSNSCVVFVRILIWIVQLRVIQIYFSEFSFGNHTKCNWKWIPEYEVRDTLKKMCNYFSACKAYAVQ